MAWKIEFEGEVYREADLTLAESARLDEAVKDITGRTWNGILLNPGASPAVLIATVATLHAERTGTAYEVVADRVGRLKWPEVEKLFDANAGSDLPEEYTNGIPPEADESSTTT